MTILIAFMIAVLTVYSRRWRRAMLATGAAFLALIALAVWASQASQRTSAEALARQLGGTVATLVPPDHVQLELQMAELNGPLPSKAVVGRVWNHDPAIRLERLELRVRVLDCQAGCVTIGERIESLALDVPPGQARDINHYVRFAELGAPRGHRTWMYDVLSVRGQ